MERAMQTAPPMGPDGLPDFTRLDDGTKRFVLVATMLGLFLAALDQTIVSTAMPRIAQELHGLELYTWVTTAYILASTAMVPIYGRLSDIYGRRRVLLVGTVLFVAASVACGAAGSMAMLVAMRAVQGLGAAALTSTAFAVVADLYEPRQRARVQGIFGAVFGLASVVGPLLGGWMTQHWGWRSVFYVNVPVGVAALLFILARMPALRSGLAARVDYAGALLVVTTAVPLMLALSLDKRQHPWSSGEILGLLATGLISLVVFIRVESRVAEPVLPMRLFRNPAYSWAALVSFLYGGVFFGAILFVPLFMKMVLGVTDSESGTTLMPLSLAMSPAAILGGRLAARTGRIKPVVLPTMAVALVGFGALATLDAGSTRLGVGARLVLLALGLGPNLSLLTLAIQGAVERRDIGVATASRQFFQQLGGAFGAALLGAVLASRLPVELESRTAPMLAQLPPEVAAQVRQSAPGGEAFGRAMASAAQQVEQQGAARDQAVSDAFAQRGTQAPRGDEARAEAGGLSEAQAEAMQAADATARRQRDEVTQLGAKLQQAVREGFAAAIDRIFVWAAGLTLLTLLLATRLREPRHGMAAPATPPLEH